MNVSTTIRQVVMSALEGFAFNGVEIPVFDELVNPNVEIPEVGVVRCDGNNDDNVVEELEGTTGAKAYIVIQDQQFIPTNYSSCGVMNVADVTIRVVTIFKSVGGKKLSEDIGHEIDSLFRDENGRSIIDEVKHVRLSVCRSISEVTADEVAFSNVLIYEFHV